MSLHFDRAEDYAKAWQYSVMGAERARKKYANVVAAELYRRALAAANQAAVAPTEEERRVVAESLGDVTDLSGLFEEAFAAYEAARSLAVDDPIVSARLLHKQGMTKEGGGEYDAGIDLVQEALDLLATSDGSDEAARLEVEAVVAYAALLNRKGDAKGSAEWCLRAIEAAEPLDYKAKLAHAYFILELDYTDLLHEDRGKYAEKALEIYRELKDLVGQAKVLNNLGYDAFFRGDLDAATDHWEAAKAAATKAGDVLTAASVTNNLGEIEADRGLLEQARHTLGEALQMWRGARFQFGIAYGSANMARVESRAGRHDEAQTWFDKALAAYEELGSDLGRADVLTRMAEDRLLAGENESAWRLLEEAMPAATPLPNSGVLQAQQHRLLGYVLARTGRFDEASAALEMSLTLVRDADARFEEVLTLDALASLDVASGGDGEPWSAEADAISAELGVAARTRIPTSSGEASQ